MQGFTAAIAAAFVALVHADYDKTSFDASAPASLTWRRWEVPNPGANSTSYNTHVNLTMAVIGNPLQLSAEMPLLQNGTGYSCYYHRPVSETAKEHDCGFAVNANYFEYAGPFGKRTGACLYDLVVEGKEQQLPCSSTGAVFGVFNAPGGAYVATGILPYPNCSAAAMAEGVQTVVGGREWLVRNGEVYLPHYWNDTSDGLLGGETPLISPRTVMGVFRNGTAFLLAADGVETFKLGLTVPGIAEVVANPEYGIGAWAAVNFDGGGSTTAVAKIEGDFEVVSHPTCVDIPVECERNVASIMCARSSLF